MLKKIFLPEVLVIFLFVPINGSAQYNLTQVGNQDFLENIVHTILVNNNFDRIDVIQNDVGSIKLKGRVDTYYEKNKLYEIVRRIHGVREVNNLVVVDNPGAEDEILEKNIHEGVIYLSALEKPQDIKVKVKNGIVFLEGDVKSSNEKNVVYKVVSLNEGVRGIVNKIKVQPRAEALLNSSLKNFITNLINERFPDEKEVKVSAENGEIILEGNVSSEEIKENIVSNISDLEGVEKVNNNLNIKPKETESNSNQE